MAPRAPVVVTAVLCLAAGVAAVGTATHPVPGTDDNGLTENESATLWSRDADNYTAQSAYRRRYGESRTAMQQLANGTDITFTRPPATAATWTRNDFADLHAGGPTTSVSPSGATLKNGTLIADAHATIFVAQPSTRGHLAPNETVQYLAPNGTLRGFVDYRVRRPNASTDGTGTTEWSIVSHEIETVRLLRDGEPIVDHNGTHTPTLQYDLQTNGQVTVTLEATIHVRLRGTVRENGTGAATNTTVRTETLTVRDSLTAEVYDLSASVYYAEYPNGDTGVAVFQTRPWQGYTLTANESTRVRGVWGSTRPATRVGTRSPEGTGRRRRRLPRMRSPCSSTPIPRGSAPVRSQSGMGRPSSRRGGRPRRRRRRHWARTSPSTWCIARTRPVTVSPCGRLVSIPVRSTSAGSSAE